MLDEQNHAGGVKSRTNKACLVQEPVIVTLGGEATELSLDAAKALLAGLQAAVTRVSASETGFVGDGSGSQTVVLGKTGTGLSIGQSRLR